MALQSWAWLLVVGGTSVLAYVLLGYPLLLALRARLAPRPVAVDTSFEPSLSILISAYCEARDLPGKLASLWRLDYPPQQLEVLVADDGSADDTALVVREAAATATAAGRLRLLPPTANLGKAAQLNRLAAAARGEVLVFTDARQPLEPEALRELVAVLADPGVGGVSGAVEYRTPAGSPAPIGAYWRYETALRQWEGVVHSCAGAAGPLLAIRRELFRPLPTQVVLDDVLTPMRVVLGGRRFVYAPRAVAVETYAMNRRHEFDRRVRTLAGNYQLLRLEPRLLLPWTNPIWWQFVSHKVGRLLVPWCLLAMLAGGLLGWSCHPFFGAFLALNLFGYLYALIGWAAAGKAWAPPGSSLAYSLVLLAAAALKGLWRDLRGGSRGSWGAAERQRRG